MFFPMDDKESIGREVMASLQSCYLTATEAALIYESQQCFVTMVFCSCYKVFYLSLCKFIFIGSAF